MLDTRQYRTDQPCGDGAKPRCPETFDPDATMLGFEQEQWLHQQFAASGTTWNALAQQVIMANIQVPRRGAVRYFLDTWSGYPEALARLLEGMQATDLSNPLVLTGDAHAHWIFELTENAADPDAAIIASEFVGTSISSSGNGSAVTDTGDLVLANNSFARFHNNLRGYIRCDVGPSLWRSDMRVVDFVTEPDAPIYTAAAYVLEEGRRGVQPA